MEHFDCKASSTKRQNGDIILTNKYSMMMQVEHSRKIEMKRLKTIHLPRKTFGYMMRMKVNILKRTKLPRKKYE